LSQCPEDAESTRAPGRSACAEKHAFVIRGHTFAAETVGETLALNVGGTLAMAQAAAERAMKPASPTSSSTSLCRPTTACPPWSTSARRVRRSMARFPPRAASRQRSGMFVGLGGPICEPRLSPTGRCHR